MPDLTRDAVRALLEANGLAAQEDEDLEEVTHRINAIMEAVDGLEHGDVDALPEMERQ